MAEKEKASAGATNTDKGQKNKKSSKSKIEDVSKEVNTKSEKSSKLTLESSMKTIAIKIYEEQIGDIEIFSKNVREVDESKVHVIAIMHNRDFQGDDFFVPSTDKRHLHLIARSVDGQPRKIRTLLNMFGIKLRPDEDANLWKHAVQKAGNFDKYAAYLTHETKEAIEDGKAKYEMDELISNLPTATIRSLQAPYIYSGKQQPTNASIDVQANWIDMAYNAGYAMQPLDEFLSEVPLVVVKKVEKQIRGRYTKGQYDRIEEIRKSDFTRCSIFIRGKANQGKTYAAIHALDDMGLKVICIEEGTKTGKYDRLTAHHQAMVLDDAILGNVLSFADDRPTECYRRNNENPFFVGTYFVATSNLQFDEWIRRCGYTEKDQIDAARTRFFICEVDEIDGQKYLRVDTRDADMRGKASKKQQKINMMHEFKTRYEAYIRDYIPCEEIADDSKLWMDDPVPMQQIVLNIKEMKTDGFKLLQDAECLPIG